MSLVIGIYNGIGVENTAAFSNKHSIVFDGVDEFLTSPNAPIFGTGDFTISFWVYRTSTTGSQKILSKTIGTDTEYQIALLGSGGSPQWSSTLWPDGAPLSSTNNVWEMWSYSVSQSTNTATWYKNGANPNVKDITGLTGNFGDGTLLFGKYNTAYNFAGNLDNISMWNTALTEANLLEIYNGGVPLDIKSLGSASSLTNWWRMGDPGGQSSFPTIKDVKGSVDMTMTNMDSSNITTNVAT